MSGYRNRAIVQLYREGWTGAEIARKYCLTPGRVYQILRLYGVSPAAGGIAVQRREREAQLRRFIDPIGAAA
jgi:uncharacterized protein (DUF433 family)